MRRVLAFTLFACLLALLPIASERARSDFDEPSLPSAGQADPNLSVLDRLVVDFVRTHKVPGATMAVAKDGRLVYARGFGYADLERRDPVQANSLMRIASVSKPITAAAILLLVQQGKL